MLRRKLMGDSNEEIEKQNKILKTVNQEINPTLLTNPSEISPYFEHELSNNYHLQTYSSNYWLQSNNITENVRYAITETFEPSSRYESLPFIQPDTLEDQMLTLQIELNRTITSLNLKIPPVEFIYNPLEYAFNTYEIYIRKYCCSKKKLVFVGMNPGPFGMCQTGVPFGDPKYVKDFLQIEETVNKPEIECSSRKILGFSSTRSEQSGQRFWSFFQSLCHSPEIFFKHAFLFNFCPIALMKGNGCNVTPGEIKNIQVRKSLEAACEDWYLKVIRLLQPEYIIAIGTYIDKRTKDLFRANNIKNIKVLYMPHPSPRAINNQNWHEKAQKFLMDNNLIQYFSE